MTQTTNTGVKTLKKLSAATLIGSVQAVADKYKNGDIVPLYRVMGIAKSFTKGVSTYGEFFEFKGEFMGVDYEDNKSSSAKAFLPNPVDELLSQALSDNVDEETGTMTPVEFFFQVSILISVKLSGDKLVNEYEYIVETPLAPTQSDALQRLANLGSDLPKLGVAQLADESTQNADPVQSTKDDTPVEVKSDNKEKSKKK